MNKDFSVIRVVLFLLGFIVFLLIPCLLLPNIYFTTWRGITCIFIIELVYIGLAFPLVFSTINRKDADKKIIGGYIYYRGIFLFSIVSIFAIVITLKMLSSLKMVIAIELIGITIAVTFSYLGLFAHNHIHRVVKEEKNKKEVLDSLKNSISQTRILITSRISDDVELLDELDHLCDEIRYLSPSYDAKAIELERKLLLGSENIRKTAFEGASRKEILTLLQNMDLLCKQRKTIY